MFRAIEETPTSITAFFRMHGGVDTRYMSLGGVGETRVKILPTELAQVIANRYAHVRAGEEYQKPDVFILDLCYSGPYLIELLTEIDRLEDESRQHFPTMAFITSTENNESSYGDLLPNRLFSSGRLDGLYDGGQLQGNGVQGVVRQDTGVTIRNGSGRALRIARQESLIGQG